MKQFWTLYWKELKNCKIIILIFLTIAFSGIDTCSPWNRYGYIRSISRAALFMFPLLFFYLMSLEQGTMRNYQLFSLPIHRFKIITSRFLLLVSLGIIPGITIHLYRTYIILYVIGKVAPVVGPESREIYLGYFSSFTYYLHPLGPVIFLSGFICAVEGFCNAVNRYRLVCGILFLATCLVFVSFVYSIKIAELKNIINFNMDHVALIKHAYREWVKFDIYLGAVGLFFLGAGMFLYEKYAEV